MVGAFAMLGAAVTGAPPPARASGTYTTAGSVKLGVPAYWSPGLPDGEEAFERLLAAAATVDTVIVNGPASGPADPLDQVLVAAVRRLADAGITVLGYVDTGYLGRTGAVTVRINAGSAEVADWRAQADADAAAWQRLYGPYGLAGVFLDQTLSACGAADEYLTVYGEISAAVRARQPDAVVTINPGTGVEECYTGVADVIVMAENSFTAYRDWTPPDWVRDHPRTTFWHLVHGADTPEAMREAVGLARERHAGQVYVTDAVIDGAGGPWNVLPDQEYWSAEVAAVRATRVRCAWRTYTR